MAAIYPGRRGQPDTEPFDVGRRSISRCPPPDSTGLPRCRWNSVTYRVLVAAPGGNGTTTLCAGLRSARPEWQVLTASARTSAKAVCGALSLDAVIVDTGLGDEGLALLGYLAASHPRIGRVALSH